VECLYENSFDNLSLSNTHFVGRKLLLWRKIVSEVQDNLTMSYISLLKQMLWIQYSILIIMEWCGNDHINFLWHL